MNCKWCDNGKRYSCYKCVNTRYGHHQIAMGIRVFMLTLVVVAFVIGIVFYSGIHQ